MNENFEYGFKLRLLNIAICLGTFIQVLDSSIANVSVPYIAGNLGVSSDEGAWVITSFAASNAIVLPLTGWLSDYFGRVRLFVGSVFLFTIISFLCGLAGSLNMLLLLRFCQGAVAGSLIPLSQSLLITNNPKAQVSQALGLWSMVVIVAPILGPIIGGYLTYNYSWRWIFYINVPIGLFSAAATWFFLKDKDSEPIRNPIDWTGLFLLSVGVICLQIMLDKGEDFGWFESNMIIALLITSVISLIYFALWNSGQKFQLIDFSFFKDRNFLIGTIAITLGYLIYFCTAVLLPLWLQTQENYTPVWAGIAIAPVGLASFCFASLLSKHMDLIGTRTCAALSFIIFSLVFFYQSMFMTNIELNTLLSSRIVQGFGLLLFFLPLVRLSLMNIPADRLPKATGLFHFFRILVGSGFGTSLSIATWERLEIFHHARLSEFLTKERALVTQFYDKLLTIDNAFTPNVIRGIIDKYTEQQAYMLSLNDLSWLCAIILILLAPLVFLCRGGSAPTPPAKG